MTTFVKIFYTASVLIFIHLSALAQYRADKWEVGVSVIPFTADDEPYMFIGKRYLKENNAFRIGIGGRYEFDREDVEELISTELGPSYQLSYQYEQETNNLKLAGFIGFQYGKRKNDLDFYGATDFTFMYEWDKIDLPEGVRYNTFDIPIGEYYLIAPLYTNKVMSFGFRQSFGLQYSITKSVSISLEGGVGVQVKRYNRQEFTYSIASFNRITEPEYSPSFGYSIKAPKVDWAQSLLIKPVSILSINYHFK